MGKMGGMSAGAVKGGSKGMSGGGGGWGKSAGMDAAMGGVMGGAEGMGQEKKSGGVNPGTFNLDYAQPTAIRPTAQQQPLQMTQPLTPDELEAHKDALALLANPY